MLTMRPLLEDNGKPVQWIGITFNSGSISVEITDDGDGAFLVINTDEPWRVEAEELFAFADWASQACLDVDKHNKSTVL